jgi:hypothetical protein
MVSVVKYITPSTTTGPVWKLTASFDRAFRGADVAHCGVVRVGQKANRPADPLAGRLLLPTNPRRL